MTSLKKISQIIKHVFLDHRLDAGSEQERLSIEALRTRFQGTVVQQFPDVSQGGALIQGMWTVEKVALQLPLLLGFRMARYEPIVLLDAPYAPLMDAYRVLGVEKFAFLSDHLPQNVPVELETLMDMAAEFGWRATEYKGLPVGVIAASSLMRKERYGKIYLTDEVHRSKYREILGEVLRYADAACRLIDDVQPSMIGINDRGYSPIAQIFHRAMNLGINTITMNGAHRNNYIMLKRYHPENRWDHPSSLSHKSWQELLSQSCSRDSAVYVLSEMEDCYRRAEWYGEVGTQFHTHAVDAADIRTRLNLATGKKVVGIFPHLFWDATFSWGEDIFDSYPDWFESVLQIAATVEDVEWVVKVHPANRVKNTRDGYDGEYSEVLSLTRVLGDLPSHIHYIAAEDDISTDSLLKVLDCCLTVRGTVGIEAACYGVTTYTAGTGRYDRHGFTIDSSNTAEYIQRIKGIANAPQMSGAQKERALLFAYGIFIERPTSLDIISTRYQMDGTASLEITVNANCGSDLSTFNDVKSISKWINSGNDDYLALQLVD